MFDKDCDLVICIEPRNTYSTQIWNGLHIQATGSAPYQVYYALTLRKKCFMESKGTSQICNKVTKAFDTIETAQAAKTTETIKVPKIAGGFYIRHIRGG